MAEGGQYLSSVKSLSFLLDSVWNLGPRLGVRYWRIYQQCLADPTVVARWESKCRWEGAQEERRDHELSKFFYDWANILSRCPGGSLDPTIRKTEWRCKSQSAEKIANLSRRECSDLSPKTFPHT